MAARSLDCDREVATIEPLVNGQQFITPVGVGAEGVVSKFKSGAEDFERA